MAKTFVKDKINLVPQGPQEDAGPVGFNEYNATTSEALQAQFELSYLEQESYPLLTKAFAASQAEDDDHIDWQTAQELFPNLETGFEGKMSRSQLGILDAHLAHKNRLRRVVESAGMEGFVDSAMLFAAGIGGAALDPIGALIGMATAGSFTAMNNLRKGEKLANIFKAGKSSLAYDMASGAAGNLVSEGAIVSPIMRSNLEDIDSFNNTLVATAAGAVLPMAFHGIRGATRAFLGGMDEGQLGKTMAYANAKLDNGKNPIPSPEEAASIRGSDITEADEVRLRAEGHSEEEIDAIKEESRQLNQDPNGINKKIQEDLEGQRSEAYPTRLVEDDVNRLDELREASQPEELLASERARAEKEGRLEEFETFVKEYDETIAPQSSAIQKAAVGCRLG